MACMSPPAAGLLNLSTASNARWPLRSPGAMTSMDTYWSLSGLDRVNLLALTGSVDSLPGVRPEKGGRLLYMTQGAGVLSNARSCGKPHRGRRSCSRASVLSRYARWGGNDQIA